MMDKTRRREVLSWMVDAYIDAVDSWSGRLSVVYVSGGPDDLHGPLWSFNAIGQSVPIVAPILDRLARVSSLGQAQWWLVSATGLIWNENEAPFIPEWTPDGGGGGVYVTESAAAIYEHGYIEENHKALKGRLDYESLMRSMVLSEKRLEHASIKDWCARALEELQKDPERISQRIDRFVDLMGKPDLGGVLAHPLDP